MQRASSSIHGNIGMQGLLWLSVACLLAVAVGQEDSFDDEQWAAQDETAMRQRREMLAEEEEERAQARQLAEEEDAEEDRRALEEDGDDGGPVCFGNPPVCINRDGKVKISALSPPGGPLAGGTQLVVIGTEYRNFGSLMRCKFNNMESAAALAQPDDGFMISMYNHSLIGCGVPLSPTDAPQSVRVEVSLNGEQYSNGGLMYSYYRHPTLTGVSPSKGSASKPQKVTITRSEGSESGKWEPMGEGMGKHLCRFQAVVQPLGKRQVQWSEEVPAVVMDHTELQCVTPVVNFTSPVHIEVSLNGQQFTSGGAITFEYEDNWHSPAASGVAPSARYGTPAVLLGTDVYLFGGQDASYEGDGFRGDMYVLHLDTMKDFYPSEHAMDLTWQKLSLSTGGEPPSPRLDHTFVRWGAMLVLFGGTSSHQAHMHNSTYRFNTHRGTWQEAVVTGGPVDPRGGHSANVCALEQGCVTADGKPRMFVFGGWGPKPCSGPTSPPCLKHKNDLLGLELNTMHWEAVDVNIEQPRPWKRKGHSATLVNGSTLIVFGGSAWVPDEDADNSWGYSTHQVNDLWKIDLSGSDGYTWHEVHTVGDAPSEREGHGAALVGGRYLVIMGGYGVDMDYPYKNETHVLDTFMDPMVWSQPTITGKVPRARAGAATVLLDDNEILTFGGMSLRGWMDDVHILDIAVGNPQYILPKKGERR